ncbi:MAG: hypothetical protein ACFCU1_06400 [Sumerlaeia bacterium]
MLDVIEQLEDRIGKLIQEVEGLRDLRMSLQDENTSLKNSQANYDSVFSQLQQKEAEIAQFAQERGELESMRQELQGKAELQEKYDFAQLRIEELEEWHSNTCAHRDEVQENLDRELQKTSQYEQELNQLRNDLQFQQNRANELENTLQFTNQQKDQLFNENSTAQQELLALRETLTQTEVVRDALFVERDNLNLDVLNKQNEINSLYERASNNESEIGNLQFQNGQLQNDLAGLNAQLQEANERDERMKNRLNQLIERIQLAESSLQQVGNQSPQLEVFS